MCGGEALCLPVARAVALDRAEIGRKRELLLPAHDLFGEHENVMVAKRGSDLLLQTCRQRPRQVETGNRDATGFRQWPAENATHHSSPDAKFISQSLARTMKTSATAALDTI